MLLLLCVASNTIPTLSTTPAYPSIPGTETIDCSLSITTNNKDDLIPIRREAYDGGRIIDISHRYTPDLPSLESRDGPVQFLLLPLSMKNGSLANASEMKLSVHTGMHVDAPGHVFDHYYNAGFSVEANVNTLDLEVLNGNLSVFVFWLSLFVVDVCCIFVLRLVLVPS